jgi:hypothetical protein
VTIQVKTEFGGGAGAAMLAPALTAAANTPVKRYLITT